MSKTKSVDSMSLESVLRAVASDTRGIKPLAVLIQVAIFRRAGMEGLALSFGVMTIIMAVMKTSQTAFCVPVVSIVLTVILMGACAATGQMSVNVPESGGEDYPPSIEDSAARQDEVQEAWKGFLAELGLPYSKLDLEPVLNTPRSLPVALSGQISIAKKSGPFNEVEAKEALRDFIERTRGIICGDPKNSFITIKDLSLLSFSDDGNFYRSVYRQATYPFPIASGYGELSLTIDKGGRLLQWSSSLIPKFDLPANPQVKTTDIIDRLINREFQYTNFAGQRQIYRVGKREEISVKGLVVFPRFEGVRLSVHLAMLAEVGRGMTWNVYFDAIKGQRLGEKQNFAT